MHGSRSKRTFFGMYMIVSKYSFDRKSEELCIHPAHFFNARFSI